MPIDAPPSSFALGLTLVLINTVLVLGAEAPRAENEPLIRIGLVADNHYDTFPAGEQAPWQPLKNWFDEQRKRTTTTTKRRYDVAKDKMVEAVDVFNRAKGMTFAVNLGDLVNNDLMWNLKPILDAFNQVRAPHFSVLGNHDLRAHNDRFGKTNLTQEAWIRKKLGLGDSWYYSFSLSAFHFMFLDSMLLDEKGDPRRQAHVDWIDQQLRYAAERGLAVIIFAHISIGIQTNPIGPNIRACPHVVAAFFGHEHKGGYTLQGNIHTVILNGQIETLTNAFAVLDVFPDRLELTGFGRIPTRVLPFVNAATTSMVQRTLDAQPLLRSDQHDLSQVGHTPAPPNMLWGPGDGQERMPPLQLDIPSYRKPRLIAAEPNPGRTAFITEYRTWPVRVLTHAPEDPVDLTDGTARKGTWLRYPEGGAVQHRAAADDGAEQRQHHVGHPPPPPTSERLDERVGTEAKPRLVTMLGDQRTDALFDTSRDARTTGGEAIAGDGDGALRGSLQAVTLLTMAVGFGVAVVFSRRRRKARGMATGG
jgi:hypothetical protein